MAKFLEKRVILISLQFSVFGKSVFERKDKFLAPIISVHTQNIVQVKIYLRSVQISPSSKVIVFNVAAK